MFQMPKLQGKEVWLSSQSAQSHNFQGTQTFISSSILKITWFY